jgi:hypothetical protein
MSWEDDIAAIDYADLVADWPPLTAEQRDRLAVLLRPSTIPADRDTAAA